MIDMLAISFSGGETSALMTKLLLEHWQDKYKDHRVVFANTGEENEETLEFVHECDKRWGFNTVWLEAKVHHGERKGTTYTITDYKNASRKGEPYEEVIKKYGIPNRAFPHCTRELKLRPIGAYMEDQGYKAGEYVNAVGIRADEPGRKRTPKRDKVVYPLLDWEPHTKPDVNKFWSRQDFRLNLMGFQGNCKWCWKKSTRKLLSVMELDPSAFDFPERMEKEYAFRGPEFVKYDQPPDYRRTFFRQQLSVQDLRKLHADGAWVIAENDALPLGEIRIDLDKLEDARCIESCEIDFDDEGDLN